MQLDRNNDRAKYNFSWSKDRKYIAKIPGSMIKPGASAHFCNSVVQLILLYKAPVLENRKEQIGIPKDFAQLECQSERSKIDGMRLLFEKNTSAL